MFSYEHQCCFLEGPSMHKHVITPARPDSLAACEEMMFMMVMMLMMIMTKMRMGGEVRC